MMRVSLPWIAKVTLAGAMAAMPAFAQRPWLGMLDTIQPGLWELRIRGGEAERLCLKDARRLIQLRHIGQSCERVVVDDDPNHIGIQYTCRGHGYGLTRIRRESPQVLQIDSQGVEDGLPFEFAAEARRIAGC